MYDSYNELLIREKGEKHITYVTTVKGKIEFSYEDM